MKHKTSYAITKYGTHRDIDGYPQNLTKEIKTLDQLYIEIAKAIDEQLYSFDVEIVFNREFKGEKQLPLYRQIWFYNHLEDATDKYEVRKHKWWKKVTRVQRKLTYFMLNYGFKGDIK